MKRLMICLTLVSLLTLTSAAASQRCATVSASVDQATLVLGGEIQITGHYTNCGNSNLTNVAAQIQVENPCIPASSTNLAGYLTLLKTYIDVIPAGQTVDITVSYTPICAGDWTATAYMRPRGNGNFLEGATSFTVTP